MKKFYIFFMIFSIFICIYSIDKDKKELITKAKNFLTEKYNIKPWHLRLKFVNENKIRFNFYIKNYIMYWSGIDIIFSDEYEDNMKLFSGESYLKNYQKLNNEFKVNIQLSREQARITIIELLTQVYRQYKKSELPFTVPTTEEILNTKPQLIYDCGKLWVADIKRPVIDVTTNNGNYILDNIYEKGDSETKAVFEKYVNVDYKKIPLYTLRLCWFISLNLADEVYNRRWAVIDCETGAIVRLDNGTARELMLEVMKIYGGTY